MKLVHYILAAGAAAMILAGGSSKAPAATSCKVTKAQYLALPSGKITAAAVAKHFGCEGEEMSSSDTGGHEMKMIKWDGTDGVMIRGEFFATGHAALMFWDGKLYTKTQYGLK